jgi:hypothetical protein
MAVATAVRILSWDTTDVDRTRAQFVGVMECSSAFSSRSGLVCLS